MRDSVIPYTDPKMRAAQIKRLDRLFKSGKCEAADVLEDARDESSPLHCLYDWNVKRAAEAHWLERSRDIIRTYRIRILKDPNRSDGDIPMRIPQKLGGGYATVTQIHKDHDLEREVIDSLKSGLASYIERQRQYIRMFTQLKPIERKLDSVVTDLSKMRSKKELQSKTRTRRSA